MKARHMQGRRRGMLAACLGPALMLMLAACGGAARQPSATMPASATAPSASPAAAATLPALSPQQGWQAVLTLEESGSATSSSGSFTANAPYMLLWACQGTGTLEVTYGPVTRTTECAAQPRITSSGQQTPNPIGQQVAVSAVGQGDVAWEVLVETQG